MNANADTSENSLFHHVGVIVLAGGSSSRLGKPKQLLEYKGKSLLRRAVDTALQLTANVIVVTGSSAELMQNELKGVPVQIVYNSDWKEGMASSIRTGIRALEETDPSAEAALFMVCDQPFVSNELLQKITTMKMKTRLPVVACEYGGSVGIPALFDKSLFQQLTDLEGDTGAKKIIRQYPDLVARVEFAEGNVDIDTEADYDLLAQKI